MQILQVANKTIIRISHNLQKIRKKRLLFQMICCIMLPTTIININYLAKGM